MWWGDELQLRAPLGLLCIQVKVASWLEWQTVARCLCSPMPPHSWILFKKRSADLMYSLQWEHNAEEFRKLWSWHDQISTWSLQSTTDWVYTICFYQTMGYDRALFVSAFPSCREEMQEMHKFQLSQNICIIHSGAVLIISQDEILNQRQCELKTRLTVGTACSISWLPYPMFRFCLAIKFPHVWSERMRQICCEYGSSLLMLEASDDIVKEWS